MRSAHEPLPKVGHKVVVFWTMRRDDLAQILGEDWPRMKLDEDTKFFKCWRM